MTATTRQIGTACPDWCDDHTGHSDGSDDWHKGHDVMAGGHLLYLSAGTLSGRPEIFHSYGPEESISLAAAEELAQAILDLVKEARDSAERSAGDPGVFRFDRPSGMSQDEWDRIRAAAIAYMDARVAEALGDDPTRK